MAMNNQYQIGLGEKCATETTGRLGKVEGRLRIYSGKLDRYMAVEISPSNVSEAQRKHIGSAPANWW